MSLFSGIDPIIQLAIAVPPSCGLCLPSDISQQGLIKIAKVMSASKGKMILPHPSVDREALLAMVDHMGESTSFSLVAPTMDDAMYLFGSVDTKKHSLREAPWADQQTVYMFGPNKHVGHIGYMSDWHFVEWRRVINLSAVLAFSDERASVPSG